jgi:hypothetical protein
MQYEDNESVAKSPKGVQRLSKFRWWYLVLLAVAIGFGFFVLVKLFPEASQTIKSISWLPVFIDQAFAQAGATPTPTDYRPLIMVAIIGALLLILLGSVWVMLTSTSPDAVKAAGDLSKVLLGFFVGVATKYIGA